MITVAQIIPGLGAGGAEQASLDVAAGLKAAGYRAIVISNGGSRVAELERSGGEHIAHPVHSKNPVKILVHAFWLAELIRTQKIDIVHARSRAPAWSAYLASKLAPCHFVTTFHAAYQFSNPVKKFYNGVMTKGERVIAISGFLAAHIRQVYGVSPDKIRTIPRGIDFDKFAPEKVTPGRRQALLRAWQIEEGRPVILLPSRLSPIKGQRVLIEAMKLLPPQLGTATAVMLGDDQGRSDYRRELQRLIKTHGLESRVKLVAHCDDMPAAYSLAALAVAPSLVPEGFGRVPVEAMAMGVPVIASELGGYIETIGGREAGSLVPPNDPRKLAEAIQEAFAQNAGQRVARAGAAIAYARAHYNKHKMVADTLGVYAELAGETVLGQNAHKRQIRL